MCCRVFLVIFAIVQVGAVICAILGTAFEIYEPKKIAGVPIAPCITLWGAKKECSSSSLELASHKFWKACPPRADRFKAAQAMSLIMIILLAIAFIIALVECCCCGCLRYVCAGFNFICVICGIVVVVLEMDSWNNRRGSQFVPLCWAVKNMQYPYVNVHIYKRGKGITLNIVAICVTFVNMIFALLPW